jgi:hypothetical protein
MTGVQIANTARDAMQTAQIAHHHASHAAWDSALADWQSKHDAQAAFCERAGYCEDAFWALVEVCAESEERLFTTPAPHIAALLWKVERATSDECFVVLDEHALPCIAADVRRLLGSAAQ